MQQSNPHDPSGNVPREVLAELKTHFTPRRVAYVTRVLSSGELLVIDDLRDALIIARIKRMPQRRLQQFDRYRPIDPQHHRAFVQAQLEWLKRESYLVGTRVGHSPTQSELFADFTIHRNGQRFRAYYAMKYPGRMRPYSDRDLGEYDT